MKKLLLAITVLLIVNTYAQENVFLSNDYWKQQPTVAQVQQAIV